MMPDAVRHRIDALLASRDRLDREVGRRLAGRLPTLGPIPPSASAASGRRPSRWQHVPLGEVLESAGNRVQVVGQRLKSSHEPVHGSSSGTCLVAWPETGRWWCSSCGRAGDAATLVMQARGVTYPEAAAFLMQRYGPPKEVPVSRAALRRGVVTGLVP